MAKLTARQNRLLAYPPTPGTWECPRHDCRMFNPEKRALCWGCGTHQPRKRKLLWPEYLEACRLAGREPRLPKPKQEA